jgi:hypothetical protein
MTMSFLHGVIAMSFALAGLFFLRFWRDTRDRLFLLFAASFWLQALTRVGLSLSGQPEEAYWYVVRLIAFLLIVVAIVMKNVGDEAGRDAGD